jgi:hypothetical protein
MLDVNNLRKERFISTHGFRGFGASWEGGCGRAERLRSWQPGRRERISAIMGFLLPAPSLLFHLSL